MLYNLVYTSKALPNFSKPALDKILEHSVLNNAKLHITGILLYNDKDFLQVLEGEKDKVLSLFARIKEDPRHEFILKIIEGNISERQFPHWLMASKKVESVNNIADILPPQSKTPVSFLIRKYMGSIEYSQFITR